MKKSRLKAGSAKERGYKSINALHLRTAILSEKLSDNDAGVHVTLKQ